MLEENTGSVRQSVTVPMLGSRRDGYRSIAVPLLTYGNAHATISYAISVAQMFGASITGFSFAFDPILPVTGPFDAIPGEVIEELAAAAESEARDNAVSFEHQARRADIVAATKLMRSGEHEAAEIFAQSSRSFDLAIVPQQKTDDVHLPNFGAEALLNSGRPVIVVPYIHHERISLQRVLVCWDGSRAAARAISDAWPLLERANAIDVVTAGNDNVVSGLQQELGQLLAQHGVSARLRSLPVNDIDIGNAILSYAADCSATMIVMGGYGHSRAREWALGGATRTVLQTMTAPVFISH